MKVTIYDEDVRIVHDQEAELQINEDGTASFTISWKPQTTAKQLGEYILKGLSHPEFKERLTFYSTVGETEQDFIGGCALTLGLLGYYNNDKSKLFKIYQLGELYDREIAEAMNLNILVAQKISDIHWSKTMTAREIAESLINGTFKLLEEE